MTKRLRSVLFWTHLTAGAVAGVVIFVMSATGLVLAFQDEIVEWVERDVRVVAPPSPSAQRLSPDDLIARARQARPGEAPSGLTVRSDATAAAVALFGREGVVYLNPYDGTVLGGESGTQRVMRRTLEIHRWLGSRKVGRPITGACNLAFAVLVITGFYLWWPRSWTWSRVKSASLFNRGLSGRARDWNWHNVIGFWSAPALIVITLSGVVISYPWAGNLVYRLTGNEPPPAQNRPAVGRADDPRVASSVPLASFQRKAAQEFPGWMSVSLRFPQAGKGPMVATVERAHRLFPARRSQVWMDASTAEVTRSESYAEANAGRKARIWLRFLHTGEALGIAGKVVAFAASLGATVLVWTGLAMAYRRFRDWRTNRHRTNQGRRIAGRTVPSPADREVEVAGASSNGRARDPGRGTIFS